MTSQPDSGECSLVLFPIRKQRFAVDSRVLRELAPPVRLHKFPHTSRSLVGVIVRRGRIIPVYDAGSLLVGKPSTTHRFYLIVQCDPQEPNDFAAIPVDGECELTMASVQTGTDDRTYVSGMATIGEESIPVLNLAALVSWSHSEAETPSHVEMPS
jgi:chemotaxis signal transduction protein